MCRRHTLIWGGGMERSILLHFQFGYRLMCGLVLDSVAGQARFRLKYSRRCWIFAATDPIIVFSSPGWGRWTRFCHGARSAGSREDTPGVSCLSTAVAPAAGKSRQMRSMIHLVVPGPSHFTIPHPHIGLTREAFFRSPFPHCFPGGSTSSDSVLRKAGH